MVFLNLNPFPLVIQVERTDGVNESFVLPGSSLASKIGFSTVLTYLEAATGFKVGSNVRDVKAAVDISELSRQRFSSGKCGIARKTVGIPMEGPEGVVNVR